MKQLRLSGKPSRCIRRRPTPPGLAKPAVVVKSTGKRPKPTKSIQKLTEIVITGSEERRAEIRRLNNANYRRLMQGTSSKHTMYARPASRTPSVSLGVQKSNCATESDEEEHDKWTSTRDISYGTWNENPAAHDSMLSLPSQVPRAPPITLDSLSVLANSIKDISQTQNKFMGEISHSLKEIRGVLLPSFQRKNDLEDSILSENRGLPSR